MTQPADQSQLYGAGSVFGSYRLIRQIGSGGMGRVFIAEHTRLGRQVALKILRTEYTGNTEALQRFFSEARAVNRINHENIIEVSDFIENPEGPCFYVMELLKGVDLRTLQQREGMLPPARTVAIAMQVCRGLGAAHDAGIVHRDLKPDNIFLVERDGRKDFVKLLDFGVAKLMNAKLDAVPAYTTSAGIAVGTPEYMSPEQTLGEPVSHLADVYATGVIIYEMISGQRPFHANSAREVMVKHMTATPTRVSKVRPYPYAIPPALDQLILHCLKKEPQDRPLSIYEVEERLQKIALQLQQDAVPARSLLTPVGAGRRQVWLGAAAAVGLLAGSTAAILKWSRAPAAASPIASGTAKVERGERLGAGSTSGLVVHPRVRVSFESNPPGATVYRDRATQPVGITPFTATLDGSSRAEGFEFHLDGGRVLRQSLMLSEDLNVKVTFPPAPAGSDGAGQAESTQPKRRSRETADRNADKGKGKGKGSVAKTDPAALDHSVVLDPFE